MQMTKHILLLRIIHGLFALYFTLCLAYLYYVAITGIVNDTLFLIAIFSLAIEGLLVFVLNNGNCPLIHVQKRIGDDKPFFELLLPPKLAKQVIPMFAGFALLVILLLLLRFVIAE
jgi:hypothetical protein